MKKISFFFRTFPIGILLILNYILKAEDSTPTNIAPYTVIGSNIKQLQMDAFSATSTISNKDILFQGDSLTIDSLRNVSSFIGATNSENRSNGGNGSAGINLRALGNLSTLTLINGQRASMNTAQTLVQSSGFADFNLIPRGAIKEIQLYKDGASTTYGSDAIAGAANVVLDREFIGQEIDTLYSNTTDTDAAVREVYFKTGHQFEKSHIVLLGSYYHRNAIFTRDRDLSKDTDFRRLGGTNRGSSSFPGHIQTATQNLMLKDGVSSPSDINDFRGFNSTSDLFNFNDFAPAIPEQEISSFMGNFTHDLYPDLQYTADLIYTNSSQYNGIAPMPWSSATNSGILAAAQASPHNPLTTPTDLTSISNRSISLGNLNTTYKRDAYYFTNGLKGQFENDWNWKVNLTRSEMKNTGTWTGVSDASLLIPMISSGQFNAFGSSFASGTIPSGSLAGQTYDNQTALLSTAASPKIQYKEEMGVYDVVFDGDIYELQSGTIKFAGGASFRHESVDLASDSLFQNGNFLGGITATPYHADREVYALFSETIVPIISPESHTSGVNSLELNLAGRFESFQDEGIHPTTGALSKNSYDSADYKIGLSYKPINSILFRSIFSTAFRAPALVESYGGTSADFPILNDPAGLSSTGSSTFTLLKGNPELAPEESKNLTFGVVLSPESIDGLDLSIDFYRVKKTNSIANGAQFMLNQNFSAQGAGFGTAGNFDSSAPFASNIIRSSSTGAVSFVNSSYFNVAEVIVEGIELEGSYTWEGLDGTFETIGGINKFLTYDIESAPGESKVSFKDSFQDKGTNNISPGAIPDYKAHLGISWSQEQISLGSSVQYIGGYNDDSLFTNGQVKRRVASYTSVDIMGIYTFNSDIAGWLDNTSVRAGVNNVFDREPPFAAGAFADGYDSSLYSIRGRSYFIGLNKSF